MGKLKALLGLVITVVIVYAGWNLIPVYLAKMQFQDDLISISKFSQGHTDDQIHDEVMKKAKDDGVLVDPGNVHVSHDSGSVTINADYEVVITPPIGKPWVFDFHLSSVKT